MCRIPFLGHCDLDMVKHGHVAYQIDGGDENNSF